MLAIVQARASSARLPGKVLRPLLGRPMLARQLERVARAPSLEPLVATSDEASDDPVAELCASLGVDCFRGDLDDVLDRFYRASRERGAEHVVRLTGDCPLCDPELIERVVALHRGGDFDYTSNTLERRFPDGLDVEVMRVSCLATAWREAVAPDEREHVTAFLYRRPERFQLGSLRAPTDWSHYRWTVDEARDFAFVEAVYRALYPIDPAFGTEEIFALLARDPSLEHAARGGEALLAAGASA